LIRLLLVTVSLLSLNPTLVRTIAPAAQQSEGIPVQLAHFSPDAGGVDIYVDDTLQFESMRFATVSAWIILPTGTHEISVFQSGASADSDPLTRYQLDLTPGNMTYTIAIIGLLERPDVVPISLKVIETDHTAIGSTQSGLTIFNASPNAGSISVMLSETPIVDGLVYPMDSSDPVVDGVYTTSVIAAAYSVQVQSTTDGSQILPNEDVVLLGNRQYLLAIIGLLENPQLLVVSSNIQEIRANTTNSAIDTDNPLRSAHLRIGHFSEDTLPLTVTLDERDLVTGLAYPSVSEWFELAPGDYTLNMIPIENNDRQISGTISLGNGAWVTATAIGLSAVTDDIYGLRLQTFEENDAPIAPGESRFTLFHASPGTPPVNLNVDDQVFASYLSYPGTFGDNDGTIEFDIVADRYDIQLTDATNPDVVLLDLPSTNLAAGNQYLFVAVNSGANINTFFVRDER
jgi:hypothetical protein